MNFTDKFRGTGTTTRQLKSAPKHAIFVWCNDALGYPKDLAKSLGREDIRVVPLSWLSRMRILSLPRDSRCIVVDHAALGHHVKLDGSTWQCMQLMRQRGVLWETA